LDTIHIFRHNTPGSRHSYVTQVASEFLAIIEEYLEFRRRQGERVVAELSLIGDKLIYLGKPRIKPEQYQKGPINKQIRILLRKAGLPFDQLQPNHSFRMFFNSCLLNSNVNYAFKELMMGP
jgi:hypothetical protein